MHTTEGGSDPAGFMFEQAKRAHLLAWVGLSTSATVDFFEEMVELAYRSARYSLDGSHCGIASRHKVPHRRSQQAAYGTRFEKRLASYHRDQFQLITTTRQGRSWPSSSTPARPIISLKS